MSWSFEMYPMPLRSLVWLDLSDEAQWLEMKRDVDGWPLQRSVMDLSLSPVAFNTDTYPPFTSQLNLFSFSTTLSLSSVFSSLPVSILPHLFLLSSSHSLTPRDSYSLLFFYFLSIHNQQLWDEDFFFSSFSFLRFPQISQWRKSFFSPFFFSFWIVKRFRNPSSDYL